MYNSYFGFKTKPFRIAADPGFLWRGEKHSEALSVLRYGLMEYRGFLLLTGDVGTGKTTLLNALCAELGPETLAARISDPGVDVADFLRMLASSFGIKGPFRSRGQFLARFGEFLNRQYYLGRNVLLIIDEAQRLSPEVLEEIRALSNLEKPHTKLLNVFLVGQEEFNDMLLEEKNRSIRQRITISYHLEALSRRETTEYVLHRLKAAGSGKNPFSGRALDKIYWFSGGIPRLINVICDHALLTAYVKGKKLVSESIATECARELEIRSYRTPVPAESKSAGSAGVNRQGTDALPSARKTGKKSTVLLALLLMFLVPPAGYFGYLGFFASAEWLDSAAKTFSSFSGTFSSGPLPAGQGPEEEPEGENRAGALKISPETLEKPGRGNSGSGPREEKAEEKRAVREVMARQQEKFVVTFHHDGYELDDDSLEILDKTVKFLGADPGLKATVAGYTDSLGDPRYNLTLSEQRAEIVKSYLESAGIDPERIEAKGKGFADPVASNQTLEGRSQNRRVEILLSGGSGK